MTEKGIREYYELFKSLVVNAIQDKLEELLKEMKTPNVIWMTSVKGKTITGIVLVKVLEEEGWVCDSFEGDYYCTNTAYTAVIRVNGNIVLKANTVDEPTVVLIRRDEDNNTTTIKIYTELAEAVEYYEDVVISELMSFLEALIKSLRRKRVKAMETLGELKEVLEEITGEE